MQFQNQWLGISLWDLPLCELGLVATEWAPADDAKPFSANVGPGRCCRAVLN